MTIDILSTLVFLLSSEGWFYQRSSVARSANVPNFISNTSFGNVIILVLTKMFVKLCPWPSFCLVTAVILTS